MHGLRVDGLDAEQYRSSWLEFGIPRAEVDRVVEFDRRWGGLALPPAPFYDGGPRFFRPDTPEGSNAEGWWFEAGPQRSALPYSFMIGPTGEFGIHGDRWVSLHESVEGWVESIALAQHAATWARQVTKLQGSEVDTITLDRFEPVAEVRGMSDTWWRGPDSLVAVYGGEAGCFGSPRFRMALVFSGLDEWGLTGG
jgi:hypothetical protein